MAVSANDKYNAFNFAKLFISKFAKAFLFFIFLRFFTVFGTLRGLIADSVFDSFFVSIWFTESPNSKTSLLKTFFMNQILFITHNLIMCRIKIFNPLYKS